jgi:hypothetical protein
MDINTLHRKLQQAEGAIAEFKKQWDDHGGPKGGSFGRALLAAECARLERENAKLRKLVEEVVIWHKKPDSGEYNECDGSPCRWCEMANDLLNKK